MTKRVKKDLIILILYKGMQFLKNKLATHTQAFSLI